MTAMMPQSWRLCSLRHMASHERCLNRSQHSTMMRQGSKHISMAVRGWQPRRMQQAITRLPARHMSLPAQLPSHQAPPGRLQCPSCLHKAGHMPLLLLRPAETAALNRTQPLPGWSCWAAVGLAVAAGRDRHQALPKISRPARASLCRMPDQLCLKSMPATLRSREGRLEWPPALTHCPSVAQSRGGRLAFPLAPARSRNAEQRRWEWAGACYRVRTGWVGCTGRQ